MVDSASAVGYATKLDSASVEVAEEKKPAVMVKGGGRTPCRRASGVFGEHKRPPDSPPSGGLLLHSIGLIVLAVSSTLGRRF